MSRRDDLSSRAAWCGGDQPVMRIHSWAGFALGAKTGKQANRQAIVYEAQYYRRDVQPHKDLMFLLRRSHWGC